MPSNHPSLTPLSSAQQPLSPDTDIELGATLLTDLQTSHATPLFRINSFNKRIHSNAVFCVLLTFRGMQTEVHANFGLAFPMALIFTHGTGTKSGETCPRMARLGVLFADETLMGKQCNKSNTRNRKEPLADHRPVYEACAFSHVKFTALWKPLDCQMIRGPAFRQLPKLGAHMHMTVAP